MHPSLLRQVIYTLLLLWLLLLMLLLLQTGEAQSYCCDKCDKVFYTAHGLGNT